MTARKSARTRSVTVRLPLRLYHELDEERERSELSLSELIVRILRAHIERQPGDAGPTLQAMREKLGVMERAMLLLVAREIEKAEDRLLTVDERAFEQAAAMLASRRD